MPFVSILSSDRVIANADSVVAATANGLIFVNRDILIASVGSGAEEGIQVDAANVALVIAGEVTGDRGVLFANTAAGGEVNIAAGGIISGATEAVRAEVGLAVINAGTLVGSGVTVSATQFLNLVNRGDILGEVGIQTTAASQILNSGFIAGNLLLGSGIDTVDTRGGLIAGTVNLGGGDDTYEGGAGRDVVVDGTGEDQINLGGGDDLLHVINDMTSDIFDGGEGRDTISIANSSGPILISLPRELFLSQDGGSSLISGFEVFGLTVARDQFFGDSLANTVRGEAGNDLLSMGGGNDRAFGQAGADSVSGSDGNDRLFGGADNDVLSGGAGTDILRGGSGVDILSGGSEGDLFLYGSLSDLSGAAVGGVADRITDYTPGSDRIDLSGFDANGLGGTVDDAFVFRGTAGITGAGQIAVRQVAGNTFVDIAVSANATQFTLQLDGLLTLTATDFFL